MHIRKSQKKQPWEQVLQNKLSLKQKEETGDNAKR